MNAKHALEPLETLAKLAGYGLEAVRPKLEAVNDARKIDQVAVGRLGREIELHGRPERGRGRPAR